MDDRSAFWGLGLGLLCLTPLLAIFQLYRVLLVEETGDNH
jgi:hypothetical protein